MEDRDSGRIYVFDEDGVEVNSFDPVTDGAYYRCYEDGHLVAEVENYDTNYEPESKEIYLYDAKTGEHKRIYYADGSGNISVADISDGCLYYIESVMTEYNEDERRDYYSVKLEDIGEDEPGGTMICSVPGHPSIGNAYPGTGTTVVLDGFKVVDNRAYFLDFFPDDSKGYRGDVVWCYTQKGGDPLSPEITDCIERHESFADWGTIERHGEAKSDNGKTYYVAEFEDFRFHDEVKNSALLNKELEKIDEELYGFSESVASSAEENYKESMSDEESYLYDYSYEKSFGGLSEVGSRYVSLTYNVYEYYGGAHGMPGLAIYLFDLEEGKQVTIRDLYKGSEAEFKKAAADATVKKWKEEPEYFYDDYDPSREAEKRKEFEDAAGFDMQIEFRESGLAIYYAPYELGPYASGFIEVEIPYDKLGIDMPGL